MALLNDFASRFRKGISTAFTSQGTDRWCLGCRTWVTCTTEHAHRGTTYVFRRQCRRCGRTIERGVYDNVAIVNGQALPQSALDWTLARGEDRR